MTSLDPTSLPGAVSFITVPGRTYTIEDVARIQGETTISPADDLASPGGAGAGAVRAADVPPVSAPMRTVSGRYRGRVGDTEVELRVDVDGRRPARRVSGDFFRVSGATTTYVGSFVVTTPGLAVGAQEVVIDGTGEFSFASGSPRVRVTIPRVGEALPAPAADVQFMTPAGVPGTRYACGFESPFFRRVEFETDTVQGVTPFAGYDTGTLPSGGPTRPLTVTAAFAEAGIEMVDTGGGGEVPVAAAGTDRIWTDRELHASMERYFDRWRDEPGWRVWQLAATIHEAGTGLRGIMFDQDGAQRQGSAVFYDVVGGTQPPTVRAALRTCVHELGHCFNLYHSHQKQFMTPPQPNRLDALSWMHYPDSYRSPAGNGAAAYWAAFPFQFDDGELVHLRHAFRDSVMMGANAFGRGAADVDPLVFQDRVADESGLRLEIRAARTFYLGEPVVVEIKLSTTDLRGKAVNGRLHPKDGFVQVGIRRRGAPDVSLYRPMLQQCADPRMVTLDAQTPAIYDSAYIGYGKDGTYFEEPGTYELRALYHAMDGSVIASNVLRVRVDAPVNEDERRLADLYLGTRQGKLFYLLGSDAQSLAEGTDAFRETVDRFGKHPMAVYARLVLGMNASRPFKTIDTARRRVDVRGAEYKESEAMLGAVVGATVAANPTAETTAEVGLDNVTLSAVMRRLAEVQQAAGATDRAATTAEHMVSHFDRDGIPAHVQAGLERQAAEAIGRDPAELAAEESTAKAPKRRGAGGRQAR